MTKDRMLQLTQVGNKFSVGRGTIYRWIKAGNVFDPAKIKFTPGGHMRILESEVNRVIAAAPTLEDSFS
jgi:predicted DNA-binding transcriptional regulator AlpA